MTFTTLPKKLGLVVGYMVLAAGLAGCGADEPDDAAADGSPSTNPSTVAPTAAPTTPPVAASPVDDGCPPDVNLMYERLKEAKALVDQIDPSLTGIEEPTCADGWAVARTVVKNADSALVLFKYDPVTGRWIPEAVGTDGVCDGEVNVPAEIQAKLGPGC